MDKLIQIKVAIGTFPYFISRSLARVIDRRVLRRQLRRSQRKGLNLQEVMEISHPRGWIRNRILKYSILGGMTLGTLIGFPHFVVGVFFAVNLIGVLVAESRWDRYVRAGQYRREMLRVLEPHLETATPEAIDNWIQRLVESGELPHQYAAVELAGLWGGEQAQTTLQQLVSAASTSSGEKWLPAAEDRLDQYAALLQAMERDPWSAVEGFTQQSLYWKRLQKEIETKEVGPMVKDLERRSDLPAAIKDFFLTQSVLHRVFPQVYCRQDLRWAEVVTLGENRYIRCPVCEGTEDLLYPVKRVVGLLSAGGEVSLEGRTLHVPLWKVETRTPVLAEVDQIEVHPFADADWAIAALLEKYRNQSALPLPPLVKEEGVTLTANTQRMLAGTPWEGKPMKTL